MFNKTSWRFWCPSSLRVIVIENHPPNRIAAVSSSFYKALLAVFPKWTSLTHCLHLALLFFLFSVFGRIVRSWGGSECLSTLQLHASHLWRSRACVLGQGILSCISMSQYGAQHWWKERELSDIQKIPAKGEYPQRRRVLDHRECDLSRQWDLLLPHPVLRPNEWWKIKPAVGS